MYVIPGVWNAVRFEKAKDALLDAQKKNAPPKDERSNDHGEQLSFANDEAAQRLKKVCNDDVGGSPSQRVE